MWPSESIRLYARVILLSPPSDICPSKLGSPRRLRHAGAAKGQRQGRKPGLLGWRDMHAARGSGSFDDDRVAIARERGPIGAFGDFVDEPVALPDARKLHEILVRPERQLPHLAIAHRPQRVSELPAHPATIVACRKLGLLVAVASRRQPSQQSLRRRRRQQIIDHKRWGKQYRMKIQTHSSWRQYFVNITICLFYVRQVLEHHFRECQIDGVVQYRDLGDVGGGYVKTGLAYFLGRPLQLRRIDIIGDVLDTERLHLGAIEQRKAAGADFHDPPRSSKVQQIGQDIFVMPPGPLAVPMSREDFDIVAQRQKAILASNFSQTRC